MGGRVTSTQSLKLQLACLSDDDWSVAVEVLDESGAELVACRSIVACERSKRTVHSPSRQRLLLADFVAKVGEERLSSNNRIGAN
jgi:hypothetical protein